MTSLVEPSLQLPNTQTKNKGLRITQVFDEYNCSSFQTFRSIGYRSVPIDDDIPFDHERGVVSCSTDNGHVSGQPGGTQ